jgi:hypothetical protein
MNKENNKKIQRNRSNEIIKKFTMDFTEKELESLENYSIKNGVPKSRIIKKLLQEKNIINSNN